MNIECGYFVGATFWVMDNKALTTNIELANQWFQGQGWTAHTFQKQTWKAFLSGKNGLLNAPTGSGKTFALWFPILLQHLYNKKYKGARKPKGLKAIWITPLRALSHEIAQSAQRVANDLDPEFTIGIRTGDTTTKERASQRKQMPDLLITTPESLHLLLATKEYPTLFKNCFAVVVDEWHELLGNKRGVQMELALSRLKSICSDLRIWGISATIGNLEQARRVLLGQDSGAFENSVLIKARLKKKIRVRSIIPKKIDTFPWSGHLGLHLLDRIVPIIKKSQTTLIFTNTRSQCEIWFQKILERYPEFAGELAMHHGSINKETRVWVEQAIRKGHLKAVVCTSSLDLGVDFAPVETVIQIGGPKGAARFLQRAGRSKHRPGEVSDIYFLPTHAIELIEAAALQQAVKSQVVEDRLPYLDSFDVLAQYLTTLAVSDGFKPESLIKEVKSTFCYQAITDEEWKWILALLVKGSQSMANYDEYKKLEIDENGIYRVMDRTLASRHRMQIGTIVGDTNIGVHYQKGGYIGSIEESFISRLNPGDVFVFAGRSLEFVRLRGLRALVKKTSKKSKKIPSWMGGRLSFSAQMSELLRQELHKAASNNYDSKELMALVPIFERQTQESIVPGPNEFLIESFQYQSGWHQVFYPFEGRAVHEAMASLLSYRIGLLMPISCTLAFNDYGFEIFTEQELDLDVIFDNELLTTQDMASDLHNSLNSNEMARRKFRDIAVISGLVFRGFPNRGVKMRHLQSNSQLLFDVYKDYEPDNLLFRQAFTETFVHQLEEGRLRMALERIAKQEIVVKKTQDPTPLSFPLITDRLRESLSNERVLDQIKRMAKSLMNDP